MCATPNRCRRAVSGAQIVINLVGIGYERGRQRFRAVQHHGRPQRRRGSQGGRRRARWCTCRRWAPTPRAASAYARSKALGEAEVLAAFPDAMIIRPSIIFGQGDGFFNLMGFLARLLPVLPLIGGKTRFQPVYVGDVADAFAAAAEGEVEGRTGLRAGRTGSADPPGADRARAARDQRHNPLVPGAGRAGKLLALPFGLLPKPLLTGDQVDLLQIDNVVSPEAIREKRTLAAFGISATADGRDPAELSVAFPQARPVRPPAGVEAPGASAARFSRTAARPTGRARRRRCASRRRAQSRCGETKSSR